MLKVKQRVKSGLKLDNHTIALSVLMMLLSFAASLGEILGFHSYMNVAVAALSGNYIIPSFAGSMIGYSAFVGLDKGIIQICSILVIGGVKLVLRETYKDNPFFLGLLTAGVMLMFSSVMSVSTITDTYTVSFRMINSVLCGCIVFIAGSVIDRLKRDDAIELTGFNGIFVSILYVMLIMTLTSLNVPMFNMGRIVGTFAIFMAARKYKNLGGAVVGALTTCGVLLCNPQLASNTLLLATSGLICGVFIQMNSLVAVMVFLISSLISLVAIGVNSDTFIMFGDMVVGSVIFLAFPVSLAKRLAGFVVGAKNAVDLVGQTASSRLNFASRTLSDIRGQISLVSATMEKKASAVSISEKVCKSVCAECENRELCWEKSTEFTKRIFDVLESFVRKYNGITLEDVNDYNSACCCKLKLVAGFNHAYEDMLFEKANNIKLKEMREFLSEQLLSMEDILNDLSYRVGQVRAIDSGLSQRVHDFFAEIGYYNAKACVYVDENHCQRVEVFVSGKYKGDLVRLTIRVSEILECDLEIPTISVIERVTKITFTESPELEAFIGTFQASCGDNEYSGDTLETVEISNSEKYVILSDGMGTGKRAKLDSMFTVNLVTRLILSGISMCSSVRLINSILRVKGWDESFATLDLFKADLNGKTAEFIKAGAAPSYILRGKNFIKLNGQAFPAGILTSPLPSSEQHKLYNNDIIILTSDGVEEAVIISECENLCSNNLMTAQTVAQLLGEKAMSCENSNRDDISISVIKIRKRR